MKNILTKSLTSLAFAGVFAVPLIASIAYGSDKIPISQDEFPQEHRLCKYSENRDLQPDMYVKSCMKPEILSKISVDAQKTSLKFIQSNSKNKPDYDEAYAVLSNQANLRPPQDWSYQYNEEYRKKHSLGEYSPDL